MTFPGLKSSRIQVGAPKVWECGIVGMRDLGLGVSRFRVAKRVALWV